MRETLFVLIVLVVTPVAFGQANNPNTNENSAHPTATSRNRSTISGCLMASGHDHYRLTDQNGVTNMVYSSTVHLDSYVGQSVTLVGVQSATPSTDEGTSRPMPHFKVMEVHPASAGCK
jgi:hypothetical protein